MRRQTGSLPQYGRVAGSSRSLVKPISLDVLVGLGANRRGAEACGIRATLQRALDIFPAYGIDVLARSSWYLSEPVSDIPQESYVNGVAKVCTQWPPLQLLAALQRVERAFARKRSREIRWGPRTLDLDLLSYGDIIYAPGSCSGRLILPHPRMEQRAFVLVPLAELLPSWRHPLHGRSALALLSSLPKREILSLQRIRE